MQTKNSVFVSHKFDCSTSQLFEWLVQPKLIAKWFGPKHWSVGKVETNIRVGGQYSIELKKANNQTFIVAGEYLAIDVPNELVFSLNYKGIHSPPPNSTVKIKLEEITPSKSMLYLTQEFEYSPTDIENRAQAWEHMLAVLGELLNTEAKK